MVRGRGRGVMPWYRVGAGDGAQVPQPRHREPIRACRSAHQRGGMSLAAEPPVSIASRIDTVPNLVTAVRTVAAVVLGIAALVARSPRALLAAYATYWVGDMLDGWSARRLGQETRIGAVLDIVSDRACMAVLAGACLVLRPDTAAPMAVFLLQFMVLDCVLSLAFLGWPIREPQRLPRGRQARPPTQLVTAGQGAEHVGGGRGHAGRLGVPGAGDRGGPHPAQGLVRAPGPHPAGLVVIPEVLAAAGVGFVSALLPVVSAEAFQAGSSFLQPPVLIAACTAALAVGQTGGKVVIFTASRRGAGRWRTAHAGRTSRAPALLGRVNARLLQWLSHPWVARPPWPCPPRSACRPLALVSATAGASGIRCRAFVLACLGGRLVRFAGLAGVVAAVTG